MKVKVTLKVIRRRTFVLASTALFVAAAGICLYNHDSLGILWTIGAMVDGLVLNFGDPDWLQEPSGLAVPVLIFWLSGNFG